MVRLPGGGIAMGVLDDLRAAEMGDTLRAAYMDRIRNTARIRAAAGVSLEQRPGRPGPWQEVADGLRAHASASAEADAWQQVAEAIAAGGRIW